ncbi:LCP family protein [Aquibacillus sp. 3ASR75-11]|uniref:LCP family protein n=1 Tax=Terrihalobacillus insolitus TaxID=2950438 RepID=A0A9X4AM53_9BACI|nr:LCP family protein [Terrihalobacillus insolitus]MDC3412134.1 LCP family protein [Terrihalobacillus insolitus]MDC3423173.1 LCP family protein [Terrihalobacillus insolitus]
MSGDKRSNKHKKSKKRWIKYVLAVILALLIGGGVYAYSIYDNAKQTVQEKIHQPVQSIETNVGKKKMKEEKPLNILLLGVDERANDSGRSDALMVLSLHPEDNSMQIVSIPRDTRTEIIGNNTVDKINHAYAFGGADMSIATVENLLDIELDYYVEMNMQGLSAMVDAVGGITVQNELEWEDTGYYEKGFLYKKGELDLNGEQTMGFVRMRYQDPDGDFGRTKRQRKVIQALIDKGSSFRSANKINGMIDVLGNNMSTNLDFEDMQNLLFNYRETTQNVNNYQLKGKGTLIANESGQDIYYMIVSDDEINKVHNMLVKEN